MNEKQSYLLAFLCLLLICFAGNLNIIVAQTIDCTTITESITEIDTDVDKIIVRIDTTSSRKVTRIQAACVSVSQEFEGYYRFQALIKFSRDQLNESYYFDISNSSNQEIIPACDPNIGPFNVVVRDPTSAMNQANKDTLIWKDSGIFYLPQGENTIFLNHYIRIASRFPDFVNDAFRNTESVHLDSLIIKKVSVNYDLEIEKSVSSSSVNPGDTLTYNLDITNVSTDSVHTIMISDFLPDFVQPIRYSFSSPDTTFSSLLSASDDSLFWFYDTLSSNLAPSLAPGEKINVAYDVKVDSSVSFFETLNNFSRVTSPCDTNAVNDTSSVSVTVAVPPAACDLTLIKSANVDTVLAGDQFTYSLTIRNEGVDIATDVTVTDTLPTFVSALDWPGTVFENLLTLTIASLLPSQDTTITFTVLLSETVADTLEIVNRAAVDAACDTDAADNSVKVAITGVPRPIVCDLILSKTASADTVVAGNQLRYSLIVTNEGMDEAMDIDLSDTLPPFVTALDWPGMISGNVLTLNIASLLPSQDTTITFTVQISETLPDTMALVNRSSVETACDTDLTNNFAAKTITAIPLPVCDLSLIKTASSDTVEAGETFTYSLGISNNGMDTASNITLRDTLPDFVSALDWPGTVSGDILSLDIASLTSSQDTTITFTVQLSEALTDTMSLVNKAGVEAACDSDQTNNFAAKTITAIPLPVCDLSLIKTASSDTVEAGETFTYSLGISNNGMDTATNITLKDTLPDFVSAIDWPGRVSGDILTLDIASLESSQDTTITFTVQLSETLTDTMSLVNKAGVEAACDADLANNSAIAANIAIPPPLQCDLSLSKVASADTVKPGDEFSYCITISNTGRDIARNITLTDTLPSFITALDWPGTSAGNILSLFIESLEEETTITFNARVATSLPEGPMELVNRTGVSAACDAELSNNSSRASVMTPPDFQDACIVLDFNVFQPENGPLGIEFELSSTTQVTLDLHDITGYICTNLTEGRFNSGQHRVLWDGISSKDASEVGSGVYIIVFQTETFRCIEKVILVR